MGSIQAFRFADSSCLLIVLIEVSAVLILRAHYTMDVFTGIVTALWVWSIAFPLGSGLDALLARLAGS